MTTFKLLVLTDHGTHSKENSLYDLLKQLRQHPNCEYIDVASRSHPANFAFFKALKEQPLWVTRVTTDFNYHPEGKQFLSNSNPVNLADYDAILLRLPHPIQVGFWDFLTSQFPDERIINQPSGVALSGKKSFLLEVAELCPPLKICRNISDIRAFKAQFPIVLKPLEGYGGNGIVKIDGEQVWMGPDLVSFAAFEQNYQENPIIYLGMKYLKHVDQGDKRIVVINGQIIGAALRLPAEGSWLCNNAQGGTSRPDKVAPEEVIMAARLSEVLAKIGVIFFGFDTLMGDEGKRVLSEINTLSIGGLPYLRPYTDRSSLDLATTLIWDYISLHIHGKNSTRSK